MAYSCNLPHRDWRDMLEGKAKCIGNKAEGRISKRVFQENKARQILRKTNIFYPLIRTHVCAQLCYWTYVSDLYVNV